MLVTQVHDGGIFRVAALRHGDERARAHLAQRLHVELFMLPVVLLCQLLDAHAVLPRCQFVRRQRGEFAAQQVTRCHRLDSVKRLRFGITVEFDFLQRLALVFFLVYRQRRTVHPCAIYRQFGGAFALRLIAQHHDAHLFWVFFQQQLQCLAHLSLQGKSVLVKIQHRPCHQRAASGIGADRRLRQLVGFHVAPLEYGSEQFAMWQAFR